MAAHVIDHMAAFRADKPALRQSMAKASPPPIPDGSTDPGLRGYGWDYGPPDTFTVLPSQATTAHVAKAS